MAPGRRYTYWTGRRRPSLPSTIGDPSEGADQQGYPTSQFGDTIPVAWGKCRLPSSYIWTTGVVTRVIKRPFLPDIIQLLLTARLRFASPLEVDSRWQVRRMWADGRLVFDATTGLRAVNFAAYDGHSSQGRDPVQESALGTANTSAHRGYMDIVIYAYDVGFQADNPPFFEAEWIQESLNTTDVEEFDMLLSSTPTLAAARDFDEYEFYTFSESDRYIRRFSIGRLREIYAARLLILDRTYEHFSERSLRYVPATGKLLMLAATTGGWLYYLVEADPLTGQVTAESDVAAFPSGEAVLTMCHLHISGVSIYLTTSSHDRVSIFRVKQTGLPEERVVRTHQSDASWQGYTNIYCMTPGAVRTDDADVWVCADDDLVKLVVNINGHITGRTVFKTFADDAVYAVYYDDDIIVWTDNAQVIRVDGATGSTLWTESVPYQISSTVITRRHGDPDLHRYDGVFFFLESTVYNFTSLKTGLTVEVASSTTLGAAQSYDSVTKTLIQTDVGATANPVRYLFDFVGDGTQRNLSDFLVALMVRGGIEAEHVICENIDDVIDGAVVDITSGVRDIAMSICDPYGIAMFERGA